MALEVGDDLVTPDSVNGVVTLGAVALKAYTDGGVL